MSETTTTTTAAALPLTKPLGHKAYGSIPHLPGSRRGPGDYGLTPEHARILTTKARDNRDVIIVQEKLDGSCVAVAKHEGMILPLMRSGYPAARSNWIQHKVFTHWVSGYRSQFDSLLNEGERVCGEWLMQAHGTRYQLPTDKCVFVAFDIIAGHKRVSHGLARDRCRTAGFATPHVYHEGGPISPYDVMPMLDPKWHGAIDPIEGAVWRCERDGEVDFLGKYVIHDKEDGKYFPEKTGGPVVWNWIPPGVVWPIRMAIYMGLCTIIH